MAPRARDRIERSRTDRAQRLKDSGSNFLRIAHRMGDLLTTGQIQVGEREVLGALPPDLDARETVTLEL